MPRSSNQKLKLLYLADILLRESDEQHPLSVKDIINKLAERDIAAERKSIYSDLEALELYGMDINRSGDSSATKYYCGSGNFELPELQLLADAVACSKFITEKKSRQLIKKIELLTSVYQARALDRTVIVANRVKTINEKIYYNIQTLHESIQKKVRISFLYFGYDMNKKKVYRSDGERYEMSPYSLAWEDENYYCVGWYEKYGGISNFRVDRMEDIRLTDTPSVPPDGSFNISDYAKRVFGMFSGESIRAELVFDKSLITVVMDKFGNNTRIIKEDDDHFRVSVDINVSPTFYGWLLQFGGKVKIISPEELKVKVKEHINEALKALE